MGDKVCSRRSGDQPRVRSRVGSDRGGAPAGVRRRLDPEQRAAYLASAQERELAGQRKLASAIAGGTDGERPADRRFDHDQPEKAAEAAMLLDAASRLGDDGNYWPVTGGLGFALWR